MNSTITSTFGIISDENIAYDEILFLGAVFITQNGKRLVAVEKDSTFKVFKCLPVTENGIDTKSRCLEYFADGSLLLDMNTVEFEEDWTAVRVVTSIFKD